MAAGRNHTTPLSLAAAGSLSAGRIRTSSSASASLLGGGEKPSSGLGAGGGGGGRERDRGGGGVGGGSREYDAFDRDRERSRSEGYSSRDVARERSNNSSSSNNHHLSRDGARDVAGRDSGRDAGRDAGRDIGRDVARDSGRDLGRDSGRDFGRDLGRDAGRDAGRDVGRDAGGGRDIGRDAGGRDAGRDAGRDIGRDYRSRNFTRDDVSARDLFSARDSLSTRDSSRGGEATGGGYGKERERANDRIIRDWEPSSDRGREKTDRERERDKRERDLSSSSSRHQQQRRHVGGEGEGGEAGVGGGDRTPSPFFGRPPSAVSGGGPVRLSVIRNSVSPASEALLGKDASSLGETRSSGGGARGKDAEKEPGELPISGRRVEEISWRADASGSMMSMHSRNARNSSSKPSSAAVESDGGEEGAKRSSPTKKRKFSPIVWDYDEKQARPNNSHKVSSSVTAAASSATTSLSESKFSGSQGLLVQSSVSVLIVSSSPAASDENKVSSPPSKPPSTGGVTPPALLGAQEVRGLSVSPQGSLPSPASEEQIRVSPLIGEAHGEKESPDIQMQDDEVMASAFSDDDPEPGQLFPEPDDDGSPRKESPIRTKEDDEENAPPRITIAASRWAEETNTPGREMSPRGGGGKVMKRSSSLESEEGRISSGHDGGHVTSGRSTSPEPGEYIQEKIEAPPRTKERGIDSDGSVGQGSDSKGRRSQSIEDEEYERELNKRELMELDEEESDIDDQEEQRPEVDPEFDDVPPAPSGPILRAIDMLQGCRSVDEFERLNRIDEGTYGVVYRARNKKTGEIVALKKVKMEKEKEGFPLTSLREINVLLSFHHPSVVDVKEVVVGSTIDSIFMVMEYMEHDLKGLMETMKQPFSQSEVKCLMLQLFEGVKYLHDNWVLHRDLKTSNLLMNNRGELKICDFGLARQYGSPLKAYTHLVVTLWYRAPELLLGSKTYQYSTAIDMWSLGCIMAEFLAKEPLFNGKSEIDQIDKIFKTLGTPNEKIWPEFAKLPGVKCNFVRQPYNRLRERFPPTAFAGRPTLSESGFDLLNRLLTYDPQKRITADEALKHDWFREVPLPKSKEFMPTFPARSEHDRRVRRLMKSPDPLEEQRKRELRQGELGGGGLFG